MSDTGWEQRMAARAKEHGEDFKTINDKEMQAIAREYARERREYQTAMTLGQAIEGRRWYAANPYGCACPGALDCCIYRWRQQDALHRAAHITVKMITDLLVLRWAGLENERE